MELPPELVHEVLKVLPKKDLKQLRLVCKTLSELATSHLFDSIFLTAIQEDLDDARLTLEHFASHIKTIIISPMYFYPYDKADYREEVRAGFVAAKVEISQAVWLKHLNRGWHLYASLKQEAFDILANGKIGELFTEAIGHASNIRKVILVQEGRQKEFSTKALAKYCPLENCLVSRENHRWFRTYPILPPNGEGDSPPSPMRSIFMALSGKNVKVSEVTAPRLHGEEPHYVSPSSFDMTPLQVRSTYRFLGNLSKLKLSLNMDSSADQLAVMHGTVAKALSGATNLTCLLIDLHDGMHHAILNSETTAFKAILGGCTFPKLRKFMLGLASAHEDELVLFFEENCTISMLVLSCVEIKSGSWSRVADTIKQHLPIETIHFEQLYGGLLEDELGAEVTEWFDCFGNLESFMFHNGPNPLTVAEMARYRRRQKEQPHISPNSCRNLIGKKLCTDFYAGRY